MWSNLLQLLRGFGPTTSGAVHSVSQPTAAAIPFGFHTCSSGDVVWILHKDHPPMKLARYGDTDWRLTEAPIVGGPFLPENKTAVTVGFARTGGTARSDLYFPAAATGTLTASAATFNELHVGSLWRVSHVRSDNTTTTANAWIKIKGDWSFDTVPEAAKVVTLWRRQGASGTAQVVRTFTASSAYTGSTETEDDIYYSWSQSGTTSTGTLTAQQQINDGIVEITAFTSTTVVSCTVVSPVMSNNSDDAAVTTTLWAEGSWNDYRGYPRTAAFYQGRLWMAGSVYQPQTIWGSKTAEFDDFTVGAYDNDAVSKTIEDSEVSGIQWLAARKYLVAGTGNKEFRISAQNPDNIITPEDCTPQLQSSYGSASLQPVTLNDALFYAQKLGRKMRLMTFSYEIDGLKSVDVNKLAPHIFELAPIDMDVQRTPDAAVWIVREDGTLCVFVVNVDEEVVAWSRIVTGGIYDRPDHKFKSVAVIAGTTEDNVYVCVERVINDATVYFLERFSTRYIDQIDQAVMLDCALVASSSNQPKSIVVASDTIRYGDSLYGNGTYGGTYGG
jgi:hypothetical protein